MVGLTSLEDATQEEIITSFNLAISSNSIWSVYSTLFDKSVAEGTEKVQFMRTTFNLAGPLDVNGIRYSDKSDRREEQKLFYKTYQHDYDAWIQKNYPADVPSGFMAEMVSTIIRQKAFSDTVNEDTSFAIFSVIFVFFYFISTVAKWF